MTRPVLMLFVGTRGVRVADMVEPLTRFADVVIATSADMLAQRADDIAGVTARVVSAPDRDGLVDACLAASGRVDGALTFSDDLLPAVASFAAARGLPGQPPGTITAFRDKYVQRRLLTAAGLPTPPFVEIMHPSHADSASRAVPLPAILKPTRGSGSALAHVVEDRTELRRRLTEGFAAAPRVGGAVAADTAFILEGLLVGAPRDDGFAPYVSVESVAVDGRYAHLAVTDRFPLAPPVLETGMMLPSALGEGDRKLAVEAADAALRALSFEHGLAHVELMLTADGPVVIEVNARAGGALPYLFPLGYGLDLVEVAGRVALGALPPPLPDPRGYAVFVAPHHPVGVEVASVSGLDAVADLPPVHAVIPLAVRPGLDTTDFRHTMIAAVLGTVATPAAAVELWRTVMSTVEGEYR